MNKIKSIIIFILGMAVIGIANAAPVSNVMRSIIPETTNIYDVGTSSKKYNGFFNNMTVSGTCTGCAGAFAWTPDTTYGANANSTSTPIWFKSAVYASSTVNFSNYVDFQAIANPAAPPAGIARFHALTMNGFTRFEQDNEAATNLTLSRDNVFIAKNTSGSNMNKGQAVYISGSTGNVPNIALAKADSITTLPAVGLLLDDITNNSFGQVMKLGLITSFDTSAFTAADRLFISTTTAGALTNLRPIYPNYVQRVGSVLVSGVGNGSMSVSIAPFIGMEESGTNADNFQLAKLTVNSTTATSTFSTGGLTVGTNQFVVQQTSGNVGIGTTGPAGKLDVTHPSGSVALNVYTADAVGGQATVRIVTNDILSPDVDSRILSDNAGTIVFGGGMGIGTNTAHPIAFFTNGITGITTERMRILSNGNVGIGTTTPNWLLQTAGTRPFFTLSDTSAAANKKHWFMSSQGGNFYIGTSSDAYATSTFSTLTVSQNGLYIGATTTLPYTAALNGQHLRINTDYVGTVMFDHSGQFGFFSTGNEGRWIIEGNITLGQNVIIGSGGTLRIPNVANPALANNGEIAVNTTAASTSLNFYSGAERALYDVKDMAFIYSTTTATAGTTTFKKAGHIRNTTYTQFGCVSMGGTAVVQMGDGTASTTSVLSSDDNTTIFTTLSSNNTFIQGEVIYYAIGSWSGTGVKQVSCTQASRYDP